MKDVLQINGLIALVALYATILAFACTYVDENYGIAWAILLLVIAIMLPFNILVYRISKEGAE